MARTDVASARPIERFAALGHPLRIRILILLAEQAASAPELGRRIGRPTGTIAYHVGVLEKAGLVVVVTSRRVRALTERIYGPTAMAEEVLASLPIDAGATAEAPTARAGPLDPAPAPFRPPVATPNVARPPIELATGTQAGVLRFIHYGFMPNRLGYCGPDENRRLFDHAVAKEVDRSLLPSLARFLGPLPYLRAIAAGAGIRDVFDDRVVEAYLDRQRPARPVRVQGAVRGTP